MRVRRNARGRVHAAALLLVAIVVIAPLAAGAAPGDLDSTFGDCGIVKTPSVSLWSVLAVQEDGKILTYRQVEAARYTQPNGVLDATFGDGGIVRGAFPIPSGRGSIETQPDGRVVLAWGRLLEDGSPDLSFVTDDLPRPEAASLQSDGKIVVAGTIGVPSTCTEQLDEPDERGILRLIRFDAEGARDPGFGNEGVVDTDVDPGGDPCLDAFVTGMAIQPDDRIVVVASLSNFQAFIVLRYDKDGLLDPTFGTGGIVKIPGPQGTWATDVAIATNGDVVVSGATIVDNRFTMAVLRLKETGTPNPTFGTGGLATVTAEEFTGVSTALVLQPNGTVIVTGHGALARLLENGTPDPGFGDGGVVTAGDGPVSLDVALQSDGKIVTAGILYADPSHLHGGSAIIARYHGGEPGDEPDDPVHCPQSCTTAVCGDAFAEPGCEECDTGDRNGVTGSCCTSTCRRLPSALACSRCETCDELSQCVAKSRLHLCTGHSLARPDRSFLRLEDGPHGDRLRWRWQGGNVVDEAFLDPLRASGANFCIYGGDRTLFGVRVPAGEDCDNLCWRSTARGRFVYRDDRGSVAGLTKIILDPGRRGRSSITVLGDGPSLHLPPLPLELPLTVQLQQDDGRCWEARYESSGVGKNVSGLFRGAAAPTH